jgi:hypothetical protein
MAADNPAQMTADETEREAMSALSWALAEGANREVLSLSAEICAGLSAAICVFKAFFEGHSPT